MIERQAAAAAYVAAVVRDIRARSAEYCTYDGRNDRINDLALLVAALAAVQADVTNEVIARMSAASDTTHYDTTDAESL